MNRIKEFRKKNGFTQAQLAVLTNTSAPQINRLENDERQLTVDWLKKIAKALRCHPWDLVEKDNHQAGFNSKLAKEIGQRLLITRSALGLEQSEFADSAGIPRMAYKMYENGDVEPSVDTASMICNAFDLTLDWIYRGNTSGLTYKLGITLQREAS